MKKILVLILLLSVAVSSFAGMNFTGLSGDNAMQAPSMKDGKLPKLNSALEAVLFGLKYADNHKVKKLLEKRIADLRNAANLSPEVQRHPSGRGTIGDRVPSQKKIKTSGQQMKQVWLYETALKAMENIDKLGASFYAGCETVKDNP